MTNNIFQRESPEPPDEPVERINMVGIHWSVNCLCGHVITRHMVEKGEWGNPVRGRCSVPTCRCPMHRTKITTRGV